MFFLNRNPRVCRTLRFGYHLLASKYSKIETLNCKRFFVMWNFSCCSLSVNMHNSITESKIQDYATAEAGMRWSKTLDAYSSYILRTTVCSVCDFQLSLRLMSSSVIKTCSGWNTAGVKHYRVSLNLCFEREKWERQYDTVSTLQQNVNNLVLWVAMCAKPWRVSGYTVGGYGLFHLK